MARRSKERPRRYGRPKSLRGKNPSGKEQRQRPVWRKACRVILHAARDKQRGSLVQECESARTNPALRPTERQHSAKDGRQKEEMKRVPRGSSIVCIAREWTPATITAWRARGRAAKASHSGRNARECMYYYDTVRMRAGASCTGASGSPFCKQVACAATSVRPFATPTHPARAPGRACMVSSFLSERASSRGLRVFFGDKTDRNSCWARRNNYRARREISEQAGSCGLGPPVA